MDKNKQLQRLLKKARYEDGGAGVLYDDIAEYLETAEDMQKTKGLLSGKTPVRGEDYFTEEEIAAFLQATTPVKGRDYRDGIDGRDGLNGRDGVDGKDGKNGRDGKDGRDGRDGLNASEVDVNLLVNAVLNALPSLKGEKAAEFSRKFGAAIDISHIRNAQSFIFNGKRYGTHELMHGGGSSSGGGFSVLPATGTVDGSNKVFTFTEVPSLIFADGVGLPATTSNGTVVWTNVGTTVTMINAPAYDIYGAASS